MQIKTVKIPQTQETVVQSVHHVVVVDCSGSMGYVLPKLRTQLKNKLPTLVQEGDALSLIWFSSKGEFGTIFENVTIDTATDLSVVNRAIDRYLVPVGLTSFTDPLVEVKRIIKENAGTPFTMSFMSDGYHNSGPIADVVKACANLADDLVSASFVEFGYYADSKTMQMLAEEIGGTVVLAEDYSKYVDVLEKSAKNISSGKKIKITKVDADFVVGSLPSGFVIARPDAIGTVTLPANTTAYSFISGGLSDYIDQNGKVEVESPIDAAYMVAALIQRGEANLAVDVAAAIGDVQLFNVVQNAFSKQDYLAVVDTAVAFGSGEVDLYTEAPRSSNLAIDPNAYNVLTLLLDLASEEGNYLNISHPDFQYKAIGGKREPVADENGFIPTFTDTAKEVKGEIANLSFDEDRPNISILVRREGTVALPENEHGFGTSVPSFIWRNYAVVKDGIVNVRKLPVILSKASYDLLTLNGVIDEPFKVGKTFVIDTSKLPVINRSMVEPMTIDEMFHMNFELYCLKAKQKILNASFEKPAVDDKFASLYGEEGAAFLKQYGVTSGGFNAKSTSGAAVDPYIAKTLEIKISSLSSIPKLEDVQKAVTAGKKLTPSQTVVAEAVKTVDLTLEPEELKKEFVGVRALVRSKTRDIVMKKFGIILGKTWFKDCTDIEDNTREIDFGVGKVLTCQAILADKEI